MNQQDPDEFTPQLLDYALCSMAIRTVFFKPILLTLKQAHLSDFVRRIHLPNPNALPEYAIGAPNNANMVVTHFGRMRLTESGWSRTEPRESFAYGLVGPEEEYLTMVRVRLTDPNDISKAEIVRDINIQSRYVALGSDDEAGRARLIDMATVMSFMYEVYQPKRTPYPNRPYVYPNQS